MKKRLLIFGGNSFLASEFNNAFGEVFEIVNIYRSEQNGQSGFDFDTDDPAVFAGKIIGYFDGILFFQGLNPLMSPKDITDEHFNRMLNINLTKPCLLIRELATKLNKGALVLFFSSIAKKKGSYDPAYGSAKAGINGLSESLANFYPKFRFNVISIGLIENSPVFNQMTTEFRQKHADRMFGNAFIQAADVVKIVADLVTNQSINRADISIDGGYH